MSCLNTCFGFFFMSIVAMLIMMTMRTVAETNLPSLFTDHSFVEDDFCSSVINDHPCVKNVLSVLVNHINDNLQEIKSIRERNIETIETLANQLKINEEIIDRNQYEIKLLKVELRQLKMKQYPETLSVPNDINLRKESNVYHFNQNWGESSWHQGHNAGSFPGNATMVRFFMDRNSNSHIQVFLRCATNINFILILIKYRKLRAPRKISLGLRT